MARSEFQDNAISLTQGYNLSGLGNDVLAAVSGADMVSGANVERAIGNAQTQTRANIENTENLGIASGSAVGISGKLDHFYKTLKERLSEQEKANKGNDPMLLALLNQIEELRQELIELNISIAEQEQAMRDQYGDDYMEDMAQTYLSEEELKALEGLSPEDREDAIRAVLNDKMLNADGSIKDDYKDQPIAQLLADWKRRDDISAGINKLEDADTPKQALETIEELKSNGTLKDAGTEYIARETGLTRKEAFNALAQGDDQNLALVAKAIEEVDVAAEDDLTNSMSMFNAMESFGSPS